VDTIDEVDIAPENITLQNKKIKKMNDAYFGKRKTRRVSANRSKSPKAKLIQINNIYNKGIAKKQEFTDQRQYLEFQANAEKHLVNLEKNLARN